MTHRCTPLTWGEQATCAYQPRLEDGVVSQVFLQRLAWLQTHSYEQHKTRADDERDHGSPPVQMRYPAVPVHQTLQPSPQRVTCLCGMDHLPCHCGGDHSRRTVRCLAWPGPVRTTDARAP
jgi:hypothetical protein